MRSVSRYLVVEIINGEPKVKSKTPEDSQAVKDFLIRRKQGEILFERIEVSNIYDEWRARYRAHFFAFLRNAIICSNENFSDSIEGNTIEKKVQTLYITLKYQYCKISNKWQTYKNAITGETIANVFSLSDNSDDLDDDELEDFIKWSKDTVCNIHRKKYGYELPERKSAMIDPKPEKKQPKKKSQKKRIDKRR